MNFTFAKELIYREPFEIERDAKQPTKRVCTTPTPKKNSKTSIKTTPNKALIPPVDSTTEPSSPVDSKKKATAVKRKSSLLNETDPSSDDSTLNTSSVSKKSKQLSLNECFSDSSKKSEDKPLRPPRKIVKKIPFDNSVESQPSKKITSSTVVTRNSSGNIKINIKKDPVEREPLVVKIPLKHSSPKINKDNELQNSQSSSEVAKKSKKESSVNKPSNNSAKSSSPVKSSSTSESMSTESLLSRTNIKSPLIQKRLKVKLGQRKTEL